MTMRVEPVVAVTVATGFLLSGCAAMTEVAGPMAPSAPTGSITIAGCAPFKPLVPSNTVEPCGSNILDAVVARLMTYDNRTGQARPDLAQSVVTKDAKRFKVTLRADARYSDATPVRAADFVKAWNYGAQGRNKQLNQATFSPIAGFAKVAGAKSKVTSLSGLKVKSERVFTITLSRPNSTFVQQLGLLAFAPLPPTFFADKGAAFRSRPMGAGPYRVESGTASSGWVLRANDAYNGPTPASVDRVDVRIYSNLREAYDDVVANEIDLIDYVPDDLGTAALGERVLRGTGAVVQTLVFPSPEADRSYGNAKLRRALALAIDRDAVIRKIYGDKFARATGWAAPGGFGTNSKGCGSACAYNPKQAKALFKAAGGHSGPIRLAFNVDGGHGPALKAVCQSITKTLGVACKGAAVRDFATYRSKIEARKQGGLLKAGWRMDYPSIESFLTPLYASGAAANDGDYSSAAFDALLKRAATTVDLAKANALYRQAEKLLRSDMPAIPLWYPVPLGARSTRVASASLSIFGTLDLTSIELA